MRDFSVEEVGQMFFGDRTNVFEDRKEILVLGKAVKFRLIFQKFALKLIKI